jgi:hypothetical protein
MARFLSVFEYNFMRFGVALLHLASFVAAVNPII